MKQLSGNHGYNYLPKYRCVNVAIKLTSMNSPSTASIAAITVSGSSSVTLWPAVPRCSSRMFGQA